MKMRLLKGNQHWLQGMLLMVSILLLAGCSNNTKAPETLVFADPSQVMVALVYIAEAQGYFKDENLTLSYKPFTSGRDSLNSVLAGEADIGVATEFPFANNILQGKPLQILGTIFRTNNYSAVVARRDRGINQAGDLRGKTIGLAPNTNSDFMLSVILREANINADEVTLVPLKPEQIADALEQGQVDAVATWAPHVANSQARFASDAIVLIRTPSYTELSLLGARPETIKKKRTALQRLINALVRAEDFLNAHSEDALKIVIEHLAVKQTDRLRQDWPSLKFQVRLDNLLLTALTNEGVWLANRSNPSLAVPDYRATFVTHFVESIRPQSVTVLTPDGN
jgi:NitT/TauT family transport system substrate-binding protein